MTNRVKLRSMHPIGALNMAAYMAVAPYPRLLAARYAVVIMASGFAHMGRTLRNQQIAKDF